MQKLNFNHTFFLKSINSADQLPTAGDEIAFVGRSNAGKSSAINAITRINNLARTSKQPGRTQLINYFEVQPLKYLVDLPGYGFARVSAKTKQHWQVLLEEYFSRSNLTGVCLIMDSRHPLTAADQQTIEWLLSYELPIHILLTKADKLTRNVANQTLFEVQRALQPYQEYISIQLFSALKRQGIEDAIAKFNSLLMTTV